MPVFSSPASLRSMSAITHEVFPGGTQMRQLVTVDKVFTWLNSNESRDVIAIRVKRTVLVVLTDSSVVAATTRHQVINSQ